MTKALSPDLISLTRRIFLLIFKCICGYYRRYYYRSSIYFLSFFLFSHSFFRFLCPLFIIIYCAFVLNSATKNDPSESLAKIQASLFYLLPSLLFESHRNQPRRWWEPFWVSIRRFNKYFQRLLGRVSNSGKSQMWAPTKIYF